MRFGGGALVAGVECFVEAVQEFDLAAKLRGVAGWLDEVEAADGIVYGERLLVRSEESRRQCFLRTTTDGDKVRQRHVALAQFLGDDSAQARKRYGSGAILVA